MIIYLSMEISFPSILQREGYLFMNVDLSRIQKILEWTKSQIYLDATSITAKKRIVKRGQVYRCNFGCGIGSEMQKDRPAVVIQNDPSNKTSGNTIVIPITHDQAKLSCMTPITTQYDSNGQILLDGQANASNLMCVSKARLGEFICDLPPSDMRLIDESLAKTTDLMKHYADIKSKYNDKLQYIEQIKKVRNESQDMLAAIRTELNVSSNTDIISAIKKLQSSDNSAKNGQ